LCSRQGANFCTNKQIGHSGSTITFKSDIDEWLLFKYNSHFSAWCKKMSRKADCRQRDERERARLMPTTKQVSFGAVWG